MQKNSLNIISLGDETQLAGFDLNLELLLRDCPELSLAGPDHWDLGTARGHWLLPANWCEVYYFDYRILFARIRRRLRRILDRLF